MHRRQIVLLILIACLGLLTGRASAQADIPNGVFVQDTDGWIWLVLEGKRVNVPVWPASNEQIGTLPRSDRWAVMNDAGAIVAGDGPAWLVPGGDSALTGQHPPQTQAPPVVPPPEAPAPLMQNPPASSTNPVAQDSLTCQGVTTTILRIERPYRFPEAWGQPTAGYEYLTMDMRLDNATTASVDYSVYRYRVVTDEGVRVGGGPLRLPRMEWGDLLSGTPVRGWATFAVPIRRPVIQLLWETCGTTLALPLRG